MQERTEIPRQAAKPKRGVTRFIVIETGIEVWFYIIRPDRKYLCCLQETMLDTDTFKVFAPSELKQANMIRTGLTNKPKAKTPEQKQVKDARNVFFAEMAEIIPYACQECRKPLYAITAWAKRCCTAHIFPKEHFASIETNPDNVFFLGPATLCRCTCHDDWDRKDADHRKTMKIYPQAVIQFETKLKHLMNRDELKRAYTYLGILWE